MAEPFTIYKLTILNMLDLAEVPLTNMQIALFFLERDYTDYFQVQYGLSDLLDAGLIHAEPNHSNTQYTITDAGRETLGALREKLNDSIETDIRAFFAQNQTKFRCVNSVTADYDRVAAHRYAVRCRIRERDADLLDLTLTVREQKQAEAICDNWRRQNAEVYLYLMDLLLK